MVVKEKTLKNVEQFLGWKWRQPGPKCTHLAMRIDRFQVSHFRPVVMEIEIGGRSEKSLGGQESAAVDQECMRQCKLAQFWPPSFLSRLSFFGRNRFLVGGSG